MENMNIGVIGFGGAGINTALEMMIKQMILSVDKAQIEGDNTVYRLIGNPLNNDMKDTEVVPVYSLRGKEPDNCSDFSKVVSDILESEDNNVDSALKRIAEQFQECASRSKEMEDHDNNNVKKLRVTCEDNSINMVPVQEMKTYLNEQQDEDPIEKIRNYVPKTKLLQEINISKIYANEIEFRNSYGYSLDKIVSISELDSMCLQMDSIYNKEHIESFPECLLQNSIFKSNETKKSTNRCFSYNEKTIC